MCEVCNGAPHCPCCSKDPELIECTVCGQYFEEVDITDGNICVKCDLEL